MLTTTFALALLIAGGSAGDLELLQNGGFEDGLTGWTRFSNSKTAKYEPDSEAKHAGARSLRFERGAGSGADFLKQFVDVPEGHAELVVRLAYKVDKGAHLEVVFYFADAAGETIGKGPIALVNAGKTRKFESFEQTLEIPDGARRCGIDVILKQEGTVWLDAVSIAIAGGGLPELGPLELANPDFEDGTRFWSELPHASGRTAFEVDSKVKASGKAALRLTRESQRRYPEDGVRASAPELGKARKAKLALQVRVDEGCEGVVVLQVLDARGVALGTTRLVVAPTGARFAPTELAIELPKESARLDVLLCVRGAGVVWFDDLSLKKG